MSEQNERSTWDLVDSVSVLFMHAYVAAQARAFGHPSGMVRVLAQRDHAYSDSVLWNGSSPSSVLSARGALPGIARTMRRRGGPRSCN